MTWVLILTPSFNHQPPAIIGGYPTQEAAEAAGKAAIAYQVEQPSEARPFGKVAYPAHTRFTVIPGAAAFGPIGATHGHSSHDTDYDAKDGNIHKIIYEIWRSP